MRRRESGFSLIELAVVAVLVSVLMAVLLNRLVHYQEALERAQFESTLRIYKTALQIRLAELMITRREAEVRHLETENPTHWLSEPPANYRGNDPAQPEAGSWHYDTRAHELVYVVNSGSDLAVNSPDGRKELRFQVKILYYPVSVAGRTVQGIGGVQLTPVVPYAWS